MPFDTDGDGGYDHKQDILWMLFARVNKVLTLYITYMDIQWGENCEFDSLQVSVCFILLLEWACNCELESSFVPNRYIK